MKEVVRKAPRGIKDENGYRGEEGLDRRRNLGKGDFYEIPEELEEQHDGLSRYCRPANSTDPEERREARMARNDSVAVAAPASQGHLGPAKDA